MILETKSPLFGGEGAGDFSSPDRGGGSALIIAGFPATVKLYADGLCEPVNPGGWACWGWLAEDDAGRRLADGTGCLGHGAGMTSNVAEYHAGLEALRWAAGQGLAVGTLHMDSQLVVNQAMGAWQCKAAHLWPLLVELRSLMASTGARLEWIPRERNCKADQLSRNAWADAARRARP
jgi:ribonuclease HI